MLKVKGSEYYQLEKGKGIILFDDFGEAVKEMREAVKGENPEKARLWRVKRGEKDWQMTEVSYKELFEMLVKGE